MKKIPPGSEAANILVGEVDFLNHQIVTFIRLRQSLLLGDLTEVPVPTKFLFILLGPQGNHNRYHEIGRSIATIMTDEVLSSKIVSSEFYLQSLTFSQISPGFYVSAVQVFWKKKTKNKNLLEKEKSFITSNFSHFPTVFYPFKELSAIFIEFKMVVCKLFLLQRVSNLLFVKILLTLMENAFENIVREENVDNQHFLGSKIFFPKKKKTPLEPDLNCLQHIL